MTKEQMELYKFSRPTKFRGIKKIDMGVKRFKDGLMRKIHHYYLELFISLGIFQHEVRIEHTLSDVEVATKNAGALVTRNVRFNIQVNRCKIRTDYINRYVKKSTGEIVEDNSETSIVTEYCAFPIDICIRFAEDESFTLCSEENIKRLSIRLPDIGTEYKYNEYREGYKKYSVDISPLKNLKVKKNFEVTEHMEERERINFENYVFKDIVEEFNRYMDQKFVFTEMLV